MKVAMGSDHHGFAMKNWLKEFIAGLGHIIVDTGAHVHDPDDDYPDIAMAVAAALNNNKADKGIALCGSGVGVAIAANKVNGILASVCHDVYSARQGVEHDGMNLLCMGSLVIGHSLAEAITIAFLEARFSQLPRHVRRLEKVNRLERGGNEPTT